MIETASTIGTLLLEHQADLMQAKPYLDLVSDASSDDKLMLLQNVLALLDRAHMQPEELRALITRCRDKNDYTELCIVTTGLQMQEMNLKAAKPTDPESAGNENALAYLRGKMQGLQNHQQTNTPTSLTNVGSFPLSDMPGWQQALFQEDIDINWLYANLPGTAEPSREENEVDARLGTMTTQQHDTVMDLTHLA